MPIRFYGANATSSTISTTSFSQPFTTDALTQVNNIMKEDKNTITTNSSPKTEKKSTSSSSKNNVNKAPISKLSLVAIALTLGLGGFVFYHGHEQLEKQNSTISMLEMEIANLKQSTKQSIVKDLENNINDAVTKQNQQFSSLEDRVTNQLNEQQKLQRQLTNQINDTIKLNEQNLHNFNERLSAMSSTDNNVWQISQANYLVHLAARKIWSDQDYTTARLLLRNADESLAQTNDPSLLPARQAINKDISSLSELSFIDSDGIVLNLISLSDSLTDLPLVENYNDIDLGLTQYNDALPVDDSHSSSSDTDSENKIDPTKSSENEVTSSISDWSHNLWANIDSFMQKFITIEKLDKNDNNFATCLSQAGKDEKQIVRCHILSTPLNLEQSLYLRENIRFRLLIAAQAVPRHQELIYQRSLNDVAVWVNAYFDNNSPSVKAFLSDLDNLQNQTISNKSVPDRLASLSELEKLMQTRVRSMLAK